MANPTAAHGNLYLGQARLPFWQVDALQIPGINQIIYFTSDCNPDGTPLKHNGLTYIPIPHKVEGREESTSGLLPQIKVKCSDINRGLSSILMDKSIAGAKVTFFEAYANNLDGASAANPALTTDVERYRISFCEKRPGYDITFTLLAPHDIQGLSIPREEYNEEEYKAIGRTITR